MVVKGHMDESEAINPENQKIVDEFGRLIDQIKIQIDNAQKTSDYITNGFRLKQITEALNKIKKYPKVIKSGSDLKGIPGIGKGTMSRIDEVLKTGHLSEIKITDTERKFSEAIKELEQVHGIGHKTAYDLVTKYGIKSVKELEKAYNDGTIELNDVVLTGLKYNSIYKQNIPRAEVTEIRDYLINELKKINEKLTLTICGSYRRGKAFSNDTDVLISHPDIKTKLQLAGQGKDSYLLKFIEHLRKEGFLVADLTDKHFEIKYMGYCKYADYPVRRIDMRYIPHDSYYTALLYFTGSGPFNKKMRRIAEQLGYLLNEYGLYKLNDDKKTRIKIRSEEDVFAALGMEYLTPDQRI
ncbi:MAG: DNA polymerase family X protein [Barrevirus sp.]|uniref:DNA-directed DNA polymerase n=1 Tax=Barrevirus sp. TaxID=2487763 RepID=A0A3G4ZR98_9VIRU|nr:MAG: DNA polymerase family X protein [Barrevirus sp.]